MAESHIRIDEGIKKAQKRKMRQEARRAPRSRELIPTRHYTPEERSRLILGVPEAIKSGMTTTEYAKKHNIPISTLKSWILGNEAVEEARGLMLAYELAAKTVEIDTATDALALARAREGFRAWSWIAERREARLYGQKQEVVHSGTINMSHALRSISERRQKLSQDGAAQLVQSSSQIIDVTPETSNQSSDLET